jgi:hypothetical protein
MEDREVIGLEGLGEDVVDMGVAHADEALQVPWSLHRRRRRKAEVSSRCPYRLAHNRSKSDDD